MSVAGFRRIEAGGLPIFRRDDPDGSLFYAPGYLVAASPVAADVLAEQLAARPGSVGDRPEREGGPAADLRRYAAGAVRGWALARSETARAGRGARPERRAEGRSGPSV